MSRNEDTTVNEKNIGGVGRNRGPRAGSDLSGGVTRVEGEKGLKTAPRGSTLQSHIARMIGDPVELIGNHVATEYRAGLDRNEDNALSHTYAMMADGELWPMCGYDEVALTMTNKPDTLPEGRLEELAGRLTKAQRRMVLVMPANRPKKWRAIFRHAKVRGWNGMLPFTVAQPTLDGREFLTPLGQALRQHLLTQPQSLLNQEKPK